MRCKKAFNAIIQEHEDPRSMSDKAGNGATHIQGQIQAQHVGAFEQFLEFDILSTSRQLITQFRPIMVNRLHTEHIAFLLHVASNTAHPQDSKRFALWIVTPSWRLLASPLAFPKGMHRNIEIAKSTEE